MWNRPSVSLYYAKSKFCHEQQTNNAAKSKDYIKKHSRHVNIADSGMSWMHVRQWSSASISSCADNAWHNSRQTLQATIIAHSYKNSLEINQNQSSPESTYQLKTWKSTQDIRPVLYSSTLNSGWHSIASILSWLQSMMNAAVRLIFLCSRFNHTTLLLHQLHWRLCSRLLSSVPSLWTNVFTGLHHRTSAMNYVKWQTSRLISDSTLPHWLLATLDYLPPETEPFGLPLLVSETMYPSTTLLCLQCLSSGHASRHTFTLNISYPSLFTQGRFCTGCTPFLLPNQQQGQRHRYGHYGHGHSTIWHAMAINGFGHSTFCTTNVLFTQTANPTMFK